MEDNTDTGLIIQVFERQQSGYKEDRVDDNCSFVLMPYRGYWEMRSIDKQLMDCFYKEALISCSGKEERRAAGCRSDS